MKKGTIVIDLDATITIDDKSKGYSDKDFDHNVKKTIKHAKENGFDICIFTSRNMRTHKGDLDKIHQYTKPIALKWLKDNQIYFDHIEFGKPWVGLEGNYVDDKNLHIEEFNFKYGSGYKIYTFDVVISLYNEEGNIDNLHNRNKKLERLFNIKNYIYVNNGSTDSTLAKLQELTKVDEKIKVIDVVENLGYGNGYKNAFKHSSADFIVTNHADGQYDAYHYFLSHLSELNDLDPNYSIFPQRHNRPLADTLLTFILRCILSLIVRKNIKEFNGQPKLINKSKISFEIDQFPNDFSFDFILYLAISNNLKISLPVLQQDRSSGKSSWNNGLYSKYLLAKTYIKSALQTLRKSKK